MDQIVDLNAASHVPLCEPTYQPEIVEDQRFPRGQRFSRPVVEILCVSGYLRGNRGGVSAFFLPRQAVPHPRLDEEGPGALAERNPGVAEPIDDDVFIDLVVEEVAEVPLRLPDRPDGQLANAAMGARGQEWDVDPLDERTDLVEVGVAVLEINDGSSQIAQGSGSPGFR